MLRFYDNPGPDLCQHWPFIHSCISDELYQGCSDLVEVYTTGFDRSFVHSVKS